MKARECKILQEPFSAENESAHGIFKKLMSTALLPAARIEEGLAYIKSLIPKDSVDCRKWMKFIEVYFQPQWIEKITPSVFSVYGSDLRATTDSLLKYHLVANGKIGPEADVNKFICEYFTYSFTTWHLET